MTPLQSRRAGPLKGQIKVPGDKSISHRALMMGALAVGETRVTGLLEGEDVLRTASALNALGARAERKADGSWRIIGRGVGGLCEAAGVLDMGNAGTAARLLMGVVASHPFVSHFTGDASLCSRPMARVITPLEQMGAAFAARTGARLPLTVTGTEAPVPIEYVLPVASAQVKSAILLAALNTPGKTTVIEPRPTRDHTERMMRLFGVEVIAAPVQDGATGSVAITITGQPEITGRSIAVPGDVSSAAFPLVAALIVPGSEITIAGVGVNPLRDGLLITLQDMGAKITRHNVREVDGEPVADLTVTAGPLRGIEVPPCRAPSMIDEYPVLAIAAACAEGVTRMSGLEELRHKESDRLAAMARGLASCGVGVEEGEDWLVIHGTGGIQGGGVQGGAKVTTALDHRIAMAFLVLGLVSDAPVGIDDGAPIDTSFPGFADLMNQVGARIEEENC